MFGTAAARLCGAAAMLLGWRPHEFWEATPAELALALGIDACAPADPPDRAIFDALRRRFPDETKS